MGEYDARFVLICHGATPDLIWLCKHPQVNAETLWSKVGSNKVDAGNISRNSVMSALGQKRTSQPVSAMSALPPIADIRTGTRTALDADKLVSFAATTAASAFRG